MELNDKVTQLEDEIKILKNEVQAVLLDLRESYLNHENPFNPTVSPMTGQPIIINQQPAAPVEQPPVIEQTSPAIAPVDIATEGYQKSILMEEDQESELARLEEPDGEPELLYKPNVSASKETVHEEMKMAWRPEIETVAHFKPKEASDRADGKVDLATIASLAQWVDEAVKRLGQERTEVILDIAEMMGHVNLELKNILVKCISPGTEEHPAKVTTREYLAALIELDSLLGRDNKSEIALLYILCQENGHR